MKETDIQRTVCDYLARKRHFFWRSNNAPAFQKDQYGMRFRRMPKYAMNGTPDIIVIKDGFFIGLEIKMPKGKQSQFQIDFEKGCKEAGGEYYVIRKLEDVIEIGL